MLLLLSIACASRDPATNASADSGAACDTGSGLAPQPAEDYLKDYRPVVVRTEPQAGDQAVDPGLTEIRVTFSKDMADRSWSWVQVNERQFPETGETYFADDRTNVLKVSLQPEQTYVLWVNSDPDYMSFQDTHGNTAVPYLLTFRTGAL